VRCWIDTTARTQPNSPQKFASFSVVGRQLVGTRTVVVSIDRVDDAAGQSASYSCSLMGHKQGRPPTEYGVFSATATDAAFRLSPTPALITGTFPWVEPTASVAPVNVTTTSPGGNP
jgi:hypothetical protein